MALFIALICAMFGSLAAIGISLLFDIGERWLRVLIAASLISATGAGATAAILLITIISG